MQELSELQKLEQTYESVRGEFFSLLTLDVVIDGEHKPQTMSSIDWIELENSPGVFIRNISLHKPDKFVISIVHGTQGSSGKRHNLTDEIEIHCISGKLVMNGFHFKAGDRWNIPGDTEYSYEYVEDTYLTIKFTPRNKSNFIIHTPEVRISKESVESTTSTNHY